MNETKEYILKVALKLFLQKNFKEVTMKDIVNHTGLSKGAFYHYFESKEKLFEEIIQMFLLSMANPRFNELENMTLKKFIQEKVAGVTDFTSALSTDDNSSAEGIFTLNFFSLLFDALKMLPDFKSKMKAYQEKELNEWVTVISNAKKNGEILTQIDNRQLAMLFIYANDGLAMNSTMLDKMDTMKTDIFDLWEQLYQIIKN